MSGATIAHEIVGEGDRRIVFVHGILGRGRNWRTVARKLVQRFPGWRAVLVDLRNHGDSPPLPAPHDLSACAADLERLFQVLGEPSAVVGHSFGGKVVLQWARHRTGVEVWVLDCPLSKVDRRGRTSPDDPLTILAALRDAPVPARDRDVIRAHLRGRGIAEPVVAWLLTSAREDADGWRFVYDLDAVAEMMESFDVTDLWPAIEDATVPIHLVRGSRSLVWSSDELAHLRELPKGTVDLTVLDAGHWLHVDAPGALLDVLRLPARG